MFVDVNCDQMSNSIVQLLSNVMLNMLIPCAVHDMLFCDLCSVMCKFSLIRFRFLLLFFGT